MCATHYTDADGDTFPVHGSNMMPKKAAAAQAMLIAHEMAKLDMITHKDKERLLDAFGAIGRSAHLHFDRDDFRTLMAGRGDELIAARRAEADAGDQTSVTKLRTGGR